MSELIRPRYPRRWRSLLAQRHARLGAVDFGSLRRTTPVSRQFGFDRGLSIDRYYIEQFLAKSAEVIRGRVLEVADSGYTRRFGGGKVDSAEVLHLQDGEGATIVADLTDAPQIPSDTFDCVVLTQTLPFIYDVRAAISTLYRILRPSGTLLATFPGISEISRYDMDRWGDYWRFTSLSARRLFEEAFTPGDVEVDVHGNVLAAVAFLHGLAAEELRERELAYRDPDYELLITVGATKAASP